MSDHWDQGAGDQTTTRGGWGRVGLVVLALVAGGWFLWGQRPGHSFAGGGWLTDWDAAVEQSKASGKPALVLFTADWCPACKRFEADALAREDVREHLRANYTLLVMDLSDRSGPNAEQAGRCGVRSIPTLIRYDHRGQEVARAHGMPGDALLAWLRAGRR